MLFHNLNKHSHLILCETIIYIIINLEHTLFLNKLKIYSVINLLSILS